MTPRNKSQRLEKGSSAIAIRHGDEVISSIIEHRKEVLVHSLELLDGVPRSCPYHILRLRNTNVDELYSSLSFDVLNLLFVFQSPECDAGAGLASSGRSS